jgi:hypothetical protein
MTATIRTVLDLPDLPTHEATIALPQSMPKRQRKTFSALREGGKKDKQHSLGMHVYSERFAGGAYGLGVRWNDGLVRKNGTGFCGRVFFDSLAIAVGGDENLVLVPEPRANSRYDSPTATHYIAENGGHVFPPRAILERRFLLVPKSWSMVQIQALRDLVFGFKGVRIPIAEQYEFGPQRERMPVVNRAHYATLFGQCAAQARSLLASGQPGTVRLGPGGLVQLDLRVGALGPWIVDGDKEPGAPAGKEIELQIGWPQVAQALEMSAIAHECSIARNRVAWNDLDTGEQLGCADWQSSEWGRPITCDEGLEMPFFLDAQRKRYPNFNGGTSTYQATLESWKTEDGEHAIRASDDGKHLKFLANDMMAADDIEALAEHHKARLFNDRPDALPSLNAQRNAGRSKGLDGKPLQGTPGAIPGHISPQGSVSWVDYTSLTRDQVTAVAFPKSGTARGLRQWGWDLDLAVARGDADHCRKMVDVHNATADSRGIFFSEYRTDGLLPPGVQGTQMFHEWIDKAAVLRACRFLGDATLTRAALAIVRLCVDKTILNPDCRDAKWVYRLRADGSLVDPIGPKDHGPERMSEHILTVLGLGALCAIDLGDKVLAKYLLEAGLQVDVGHGNLAMRLAWLKTKTGDLSQYASYMAALEAFLG